jgi:hypothetical protein
MTRHPAFGGVSSIGIGIGIGAGTVIGIVIASAFVALSAQTSTAPRNDLPQPYRTTRDWGELPPGMAWPAVTAVEPAPDGSIYVIERCFENSCAGRREPPILKYDANGRLLGAWGEGMFVFPHGATGVIKYASGFRNRTGQLRIAECKGHVQDDDENCSDRQSEGTALCQPQVPTEIHSRDYIANT